MPDKEPQDKITEAQTETTKPKASTETVEPVKTDEAVETAVATEEYTQPVTVQPVQFSSFENESSASVEDNHNLDLLLDIELELTVELGKCELPIKKVLELTKGSIIELNRIAGEPVDLYANGKHIANGEVVVIGDNFGLRIMGITAPENRIKHIN